MMDMQQIQSLMGEVAERTGHTVHVGRHPHRTDYFVTCGDHEFEGSTIQMALESVIDALVVEAKTALLRNEQTIKRYQAVTALGMASAVYEELQEEGDE